MDLAVVAAGAAAADEFKVRRKPAMCLEQSSGYFRCLLCAQQPPVFPTRQAALSNLERQELTGDALDLACAHIQGLVGKLQLPGKLLEQVGGK